MKSLFICIFCHNQWQTFVSQLLWGVWKFPVLTSSHFLVCNVNSVHCVPLCFSFCFSVYLCFCIPLHLYLFHPFCISISPSSPPASSSPVCQRPLRPHTFALDLSTRPLKRRWGVCVFVCRLSALLSFTNRSGCFFPHKIDLLSVFLPSEFSELSVLKFLKTQWGFHSKLTALTGWFWVLLRTQETTMVWPVSPFFLISIAAPINRKYTTSLSNKIQSVFCRH